MNAKQHFTKMFWLLTKVEGFPYFIGVYMSKQCDGGTRHNGIEKNFV